MIMVLNNYNVVGYKVEIMVQLVRYNYNNYNGTNIMVMSNIMCHYGTMIMVQI
jgi:hypothetical protein